MFEMGILEFSAAALLVAACLGGWRLNRARLAAGAKARLDALTGLMNDRAFAERSTDILDGSRDISSEIVVVMFDIDGMGAINQRFGREFGDFVLRLFAEKAAAEIRDGDLLFRLGGDEFCFILTHSSERDATAIAERICAAFSAKKLRARKKQNVQPTASVGLASSRHAGFNIETLKAAADAALQEARQDGGGMRTYRPQGRPCLRVAA